MNHACLERTSRPGKLSRCKDDYRGRGGKERYCALVPHNNSSFMLMLLKAIAELAPSGFVARG